MYHSKSATPVDDEKDFEKGRIRLEDDRVDRGRDGDVDSDDKSKKISSADFYILDFGFCHTFWF